MRGFIQHYRDLGEGGKEDIWMTAGCFLYGAGTMSLLVFVVEMKNVWAAFAASFLLLGWWAMERAINMRKARKERLSTRH